MSGPRPRVGISACLLGEAVRWDGGHRHAVALVEALEPEVIWLAVCPEVELGLGVPRPPIQLERRAESVRLIRPSSGDDLTSRMDALAASRVAGLLAAGICGYVLKARSPSCGLARVPEWQPDGTAAPIGRGRFAAALVAQAPGLPVAEEEDLPDAPARVAFLARVRAYAAARAERA